MEPKTMKAAYVATSARRLARVEAMSSADDGRDTAELAHEQYEAETEFADQLDRYVDSRIEAALAAAGVLGLADQAPAVEPTMPASASIPDSVGATMNLHDSGRPGLTRVTAFPATPDHPARGFVSFTIDAGGLQLSLLLSPGRAGEIGRQLVEAADKAVAPGAPGQETL